MPFSRAVLYGIGSFVSTVSIGGLKVVPIRTCHPGPWCPNGARGTGRVPPSARGSYFKLLRTSLRLAPLDFRNPAHEAFGGAVAGHVAPGWRQSLVVVCLLTGLEPVQMARSYSVVWTFLLRKNTLAAKHAHQCINPAGVT